MLVDFIVELSLKKLNQRVPKKSNEYAINF